MAKIEIPMPQLGESLTEGTIIKWNKKVGDTIKKDETLLEISTDKVDSEIPSSTSGVVSKIYFEEGKTVPIKTIIAEIETDASNVSQKDIPQKKEEVKQVETKTEIEKPISVSSPVQKLEKPQPGRFYSPLVLNIARTENISMSELEQIAGTGENGRVSKKDILAYVEAKKHGKVSSTISSSLSTQKIETTLKHVDSGELIKKYPQPQYEILQMSNVLQKMAEHMVKSVQTSPHVQAIHTCDFTEIAKFREINAIEFEKQEGFKLTFMPFIANAIVQALKEFPIVNSSVEGDKIILKKFINLGIAVASEQGLIVPVIKNAEEKNFLGIARNINDLALKTRTKKLQMSDIENGTFTISNYGVFGNIIGMPIINQPQVAILGTGAIKKQPVVINDAIAIRSISYFTLSFDHRIIDGAIGGQFLMSVIRNIENFNFKNAI